MLGNLLAVSLMPLRNQLWILALPVLFFAGCFRPAFQPLGAVVGGLEARELCEKMNLKRPVVHSLRVLADATVARAEERASFRYVILSKEPSNFRIDVLPVTGAFTLGLLVAHDGKALWLNAQEKTFAEARDERDLVAEYLGLQGISRETAVALMTGIIPQLPCSSVRVYELEGGERLFIDDEAHIAWRVRSDFPQVHAVQVLAKDGSALEMEGRFSQRASGVGSTLTMDIFGPANARVEMSIAKMVLNPSLSDDLFHVHPPSDYSRLE